MGNKKDKSHRSDQGNLAVGQTGKRSESRIVLSDQDRVALLKAGSAGSRSSLLAAAASSGRGVQGAHASRAFAILLDATGSMSSLISQAKANITTILENVARQSKAAIPIRIYTYKDYDVSEVVASSSMTADAGQLRQWLSAIRVEGGGANEGEAIEAALEAVYTTNEVAAVLMAGDEPSNPSHDPALSRLNKTTAHGWARRFKDRGVPIHTFAVGSRDDTRRDFAQIADLSGGRAGRLDGSEAMTDMAVMAILSSLGGVDAVQEYMGGRALSTNAKAFGALLLSAPKTTTGT